jgi:hypothetical protein
VLRHLVLTEGWRGLSKGFSLNVIKGPIALSISLTTYDLLRAYLHTEDPEGGGGGGGGPSSNPSRGSSSGGESAKRVRKVTDEFSRHRHFNMDENRMHCNTETPSVSSVGGPKS